MDPQAESRNMVTPEYVLQEIMLRMQQPVPKYQYLSCFSKRYTQFRYRCEACGIVTIAEGHTRREARQWAAQGMLNELIKEGILIPPNHDNRPFYHEVSVDTPFIPPEHIVRRPVAAKPRCRSPSPPLRLAPTDYSSLLAELCDDFDFLAPQFEVVPTEPPHKRFHTVRAWVGSHERIVRAKTKTKATDKAAKKLYIYMKARLIEIDKFNRSSQKEFMPRGKRVKKEKENDAWIQSLKTEPPRVEKQNVEEEQKTETAEGASAAGGEVLPLNEIEKEPSKTEITDETEDDLLSETENNLLNEAQKELANDTKRRLANEIRKALVSETKKELENENKDKLANESVKEAGKETKKKISNESKHEFASESKKELVNENKEKLGNETKKDLALKKKNKLANGTKEEHANKTEKEPAKETKKRLANEIRKEPITETKKVLVNETEKQPAKETKEELTKEIKEELADGTKKEPKIETKKELANKTETKNQSDKEKSINETRNRLANEIKKELAAAFQKALAKGPAKQDLANETKKDKTQEELVNETKQEVVNKIKAQIAKEMNKEGVEGLQMFFKVVPDTKKLKKDFNFKNLVVCGGVHIPLMLCKISTWPKTKPKEADSKVEQGETKQENENKKAENENGETASSSIKKEPDLAADHSIEDNNPEMNENSPPESDQTTSQVLLPEQPLSDANDSLLLQDEQRSHDPQSVDPTFQTEPNGSISST